MRAPSLSSTASSTPLKAASPLNHATSKRDSQSIIANHPSPRERHINCHIAFAGEGMMDACENCLSTLNR